MTREGDTPVVLVARDVFHEGPVRIADVACSHTAGRGQSTAHLGGHEIVLVRRGCFTRVINGNAELYDSTVAYGTNPSDEQRFDHPHSFGDECTAITWQSAVLAELWDGDPTLPRDAMRVTPTTDIEHRLLLRAVRRREAPQNVLERAVALTGALLDHHDPRRVGHGRPATARARRILCSDARQLLAVDPSLTVPELATVLDVSPHHLSRIFHAETGLTITRHRMRLRARSALERLAAGESSLARLAADLGFADQSHMCRILRAETGRNPTTLRGLLA